MARRKTISIPAPIAKSGDVVEVANYRCRPLRWEHGTVQRIEYVPPASRTRHDGTAYRTEGAWSYDVYINRPEHRVSRGRTRRGYTITVGSHASWHKDVIRRRTP